MKTPLSLATSFMLASCLCSPVLQAQRSRPIAAPVVPDESPAEIFTDQPGVRLSLFAEHPQVVTPTGIDVDTQGRVWVVASHTHFRPDDYDGPQHDEVLILSDTDGDGRADDRRVFYNKTDATMDLELSADDEWVYLAERDRILRVRDSDDDGIGDIEETLADLTTQATYPHNGLSGLAWHPDGDLSFALGENFNNEWTLRGTDGSQVRGTGEGGILRCRPDGSQLRRIAWGFWNPFGVCVRADGTMFAAENDPGARPPCRLLHVVEGGDYGYQRLYGPAAVHPFVCWNGELRGTLPMLHPVGEAPCGIAELGGGLIVPSWADHRVDFLPLHPKGASFQTERVRLLTGSDFFRPTCITRAADGVYYLADWVFGTYEIHGQGRIWRLEIDRDVASWVTPATPEPANKQAILAERLRDGSHDKTEAELYTLAQDADPFLANAAIVALAQRAANWDVDQPAKPSPIERSIAVLAVRRAHPHSGAWARRFLDDSAPEVQFEALRWIADEQLTSFLPEVERLLQKPETDFPLFVASLAAYNTLTGNPRVGVAEPKMLLKRIEDDASPSSLRAYALRLFDPTDQRLKTPVLAKLIRTNDDTLRQETIRTLVARRGADVQDLLTSIATDDDQSPALRAEAIMGLTVATDLQRRQLVELAGHSDAVIREEALRSLRFAELSDPEIETLEQVRTDHPQSADLVDAVIDAKSLESDRPPPTDIAAWLARLDDVMGDADVAAGRRIFAHPSLSKCTVCHRHAGRGGVVGPELTNIGHGSDRAALLTSLLLPSKDVAPQYFPWTLLLEDGTTFTGIMLRKGGRSGREYYRDINGNEQGFMWGDIALRKEVNTSLMPVGLQKQLTNRELRDLLAFLRGR